MPVLCCLGRSVDGNSVARRSLHQQNATAVVGVQAWRFEEFFWLGKKGSVCQQHSNKDHDAYITQERRSFPPPKMCSPILCSLTGEAFPTYPSPCIALSFGLKLRNHTSDKCIVFSCWSFLCSLSQTRIKFLFVDLAFHLEGHTKKRKGK